MRLKSARKWFNSIIGHGDASVEVRTLVCGTNSLGSFPRRHTKISKGTKFASLAQLVECSPRKGEVNRFDSVERLVVFMENIILMLSIALIRSSSQARETTISITDVGKIPSFIILMPNSAAKHGKIVCFAAVFAVPVSICGLVKTTDSGKVLPHSITKHIVQISFIMVLRLLWETREASFAPVAQLVETRVSKTRGCRFESDRGHQIDAILCDKLKRRL